MILTLVTLDLVLINQAYVKVAYFESVTMSFCLIHDVVGVWQTYSNEWYSQM